MQLLLLCSCSCCFFLEAGGDPGTSVALLFGWDVFISCPDSYHSKLLVA